MKLTYLLPTVLLTCLAWGASAQGISVGPRVGVNSSYIDSKLYNTGTPLGAQAKEDFENGRDRITGLQGGIMVNVGINNNLSFQPEINYSSKGTTLGGTFEGLAREQEIKLNYLEMPVLVKLSTGTEKFKASLLFGPYLAYLLNGSDDLTLGGQKIYGGDLKFEPSKELKANEAPYHYERFDLGGTVGVELGYRTGKGTFLIDARYNHGVKEVNVYHNDVAETSLRLTNRTFGVSLGWLYHFPYTPKEDVYDDFFDDDLDSPNGDNSMPSPTNPQQ